MINSKKICFVIHNRANFARVKSIIFALSKKHNVEIFVVFASSSLLKNYGRIDDEHLLPKVAEKIQIYNVVMGDEPISMVKTTGLAAIDLAQIFHRIKPSCVVTVADRHETLGTAIAASYMNIPVVHTQGGEVSGSIDESVRHACTKLSHLHFPATDRAKEVVLQLGENPEFVFNFGCPGMDVVAESPYLPASEVLRKYKGVGPKIEVDTGFQIVIQHPVTTHFESSTQDSLNLLNAVVESEKSTIWLWPNVDSGSDAIVRQLRRSRELKNPNNVNFYTNFSPEDYANLLKRANCIVGNSSSGIREANFLGLPSVTIGDRQTGRELGENVISSSFDPKEILSAITFQWSHGRYSSASLYGDGKSGEKIATKLAETDIPITKIFHRK